MISIAVLFTNYGPYHLSRVSCLYQHCCKIGWDVVGIELARSESEYAWRAKIKDLPFKFISTAEDQPLEQVKFHHLLRQLYTVLNQVQPDVIVIAGYARAAMLTALLWSLWHRKPAILLSETTERDAPRFRLQETLKSWLLKGYKAALVGGKPHTRYLVKLGMAPNAIFSGYDVVGNATFHPNNIKFLAKPLERPYFLAINRFIPKKNLLFVLTAYTAYRQTVGINAWDLVLCGDGQLRPQLEQFVAQYNLQTCVHLPGFLQQEQLLPYFAHAGCFIHASTQEQWGLVVNEAMAAGLPVLVSNHCGCFEDLVIEGISGFGFDPENKQQLTDLMNKVSSIDIDLAKMGQAALEHIQKFSPNYFAEGLTSAIKYALSN